jgi:hypothetical protein
MHQLSDLDDGALVQLALGLNEQMLATAQLLRAMQANSLVLQAELERRRAAYRAIPATVSELLERASHGG